MLTTRDTQEVVSASMCHPSCSMMPYRSVPAVRRKEVINVGTGNTSASNQTIAVLERITALLAIAAGFSQNRKFQCRLPCPLIWPV